MPVHDGAASGTEIDIAFPGIAAASLVFIENKTGQELNMAWGGNWFPHLPDGGAVAFLFPKTPETGGVSALRFMLTQAQVGEGHINYTVAGT